MWSIVVSIVIGGVAIYVTKRLSDKAQNVLSKISERAERIETKADVLLDRYQPHYRQALEKEGGFTDQQIRTATALSTVALAETLEATVKVIEPESVGGAAEVAEPIELITGDEDEPAKSDAPIEEQPKWYQRILRRQRKTGFTKPEDEDE